MDKVYLQMYSWMDGSEYDNRAFFEETARMGYAGVELFGPNFSMDPVELKNLLQELKLDPISMHAPATELVEQMIPFGQAVGVKFMGIGMEYMKDGADAHAFAAKLNELGEKCASAGMMLIYHNHTHEFLSAEGKRIEDILMQETNPEYVGFELDAGWCAASGNDPIELIHQYAGRFKLVHLKECDKVIGPQVPTDFNAIPKDEHGVPMFTEEQLAKMQFEQSMNCAAGKGIVDWTALKAVADEQGCAAYIVERELTYGDNTRAACLQEDLDYYKNC